MLGNQEAVRMDMFPNSAIKEHLSGLKPRMHSFETALWISCSKFKRCAMVRDNYLPCRFSVMTLD